MTKEAKATLCVLVSNAFAGAEDDLHRARLSFRGHSAEDMQREHGHSGRTRKEVLDEAEQRVEHLRRVKAELLS